MGRLFSARAATGRRSPAIESVDPAFNQICLSLQQMHRGRRFLEVRLEGDKVSYQSAVLEVDVDAKTVLIDELFPAEVEALPGQKLRVHCREADGALLNFQTHVLTVEREDGALAYRLALPRSLEQDQRRSAYRLSVARHMQVEPEFIGPDSHRHRALLKNVSISGVGLELLGDVGGSWQVGDELQHLLFDIAGVDVSCDVEIKNIRVVDSEPALTLVGAQFVDLPHREQRLLERCIVGMQRDKIQLERSMV